MRKVNVDIVFVQNFFEKLESQGIDYCVLRNADEICSGNAHDIDMTINFERYDDVIECLKETGGNTWHIHRIVEKDDGNLIAIHLYTLDDNCPILIHFDFFKYFSWQGYKLISFKRLMNGKRKREWLYEASPEVQAVTMLFSRLLYQGHIKEKYQEYIYTTFLNREAQVKSVMSIFLSSDFVNPIYEDVITKDWINIESEINVIRRSIQSKLDHTQKNTALKRHWFALKRMMTKLGLEVYMSKPDDDLIADVGKLLSRTFQPEDIVTGGTRCLEKRVLLSKGCLIFENKKPIFSSYIEIDDTESNNEVAIEILDKLAERYQR